MFKPGDLVRYNNMNSSWNGTLWRVLERVGSFNDLSLSLEQPHGKYFRGYKAIISISMLRLEHRQGGFGKWFKEHSK